MIISIPVKEIGMIKKKSKLYKVRVNLLIEWDPSSIYLVPSLITSSFDVLDQSSPERRRSVPQALFYLNVGQVL